MMKREPFIAKSKTGYDANNLKGNQFFNQYKKQWENEIHFVVDDYKTNIFSPKNNDFSATSPSINTRNDGELKRKIT
jgi:hypothetical protein